MAKNKTKIRESAGDQVLAVITTIVLLLIIIVVAYPVIYVISCSFSSTEELLVGNVLFLPKGFTLEGYKFVMGYERVWVGYRNTLMYTVLSVSITMFMTIMAAYPLSKKSFQGRNAYMKIFFFTTLFGAGLIPNYLIRTNFLHITGTIWAVILAGIVSVHNVIILRTAFSSSIPGELFDAAMIDGANDFQCLVKIALPLAKATVSVITLYSIVGCWNDYFNALVYLAQVPDLWPLQLILRGILTANVGINASDMSSAEAESVREGQEQIKYCLIVMSTVPVLLAYAVVQKYFKKGVMVGSVKG